MNAPQRIGMLIKFTAQRGQRDALAEHLASLVEVAQAEVGTQVYLVSTSPAEPDAVYLIEVYADAGGLERHNAGEKIISAKGKTETLLAGPPQVVPLSPLAGKGL
ncbi:putative quinol monooxygenase [Deinococcus sp.]|uniref:putative quinol monooxygenase n=1 Tax=Deinococcus sp. TaxID=47478 RepID=UPI003CC5FCC6